MNDKISGQTQDIYNNLNDIKSDMIKDNRWSILHAYRINSQKTLEYFKNAVTDPSASSADVFDATQRLKQSVYPWTKGYASN